MTKPTRSSNPPLPPTTQEEDAISRLRLLRSRRVGPSTYRRLLADYGSPAAALSALPDVARAAGVADYAACPAAVVQAELAAGRAAAARLIWEDDPLYPAHLRAIADAPPVLWCLGNSALLARPMIALVGARNASSLGLRMARKLAADLGEAGFVVASGLARGIDTAAHLGALGTGTVAVQAGGVDVIYPAENTGLAHDIAKQGLRMAEMPPGLQPQARHFPARNRIISGLAQAVVVVEAAARSGSLITARNALDQAREVFAVPGHPYDARAAGCNMLLRDGATLVRSAEDVIAALAPLAAPPPPPPPPVPVARAAVAHPALRNIAALQRLILSRLGAAPLAEDQLLRDLAVPATAVGPVLVDLELDGRITRHSGGMLARAV